MRITLSANAGISIKTENKTIWVDAVHKIKSIGYSAVSGELFERLFTESDFKNPDILCFTHRHSDHFSAELMRESLDRCKNAVAVVPEKKRVDFFGRPDRIDGIDQDRIKWFDKDEKNTDSDHLIDNTGTDSIKCDSFEENLQNESDCRFGLCRVHTEDITFKLDELTFRFFKTIHMGEPYKNDPHCSILIQTKTTDSSGIRTILIAGDASLSDDGLSEFVVKENLHIDLAIMPYAWVSVSQGRRMLEGKIKPKQLLLTHLPYEEDDSEGYIDSTLRMIERMSFSDRIHYLDKPLESVDIIL